MSAFDSICKVASIYYQHLMPYMTALFGLTTSSVVKEQSVAVRAIEFWSVICEVRAFVSVLCVECRYPRPPLPLQPTPCAQEGVVHVARPAHNPSREPLWWSLSRGNTGHSCVCGEEGGGELHAV
jgi:hypothetical protein